MRTNTTNTAIETIKQNFRDYVNENAWLISKYPLSNARKDWSIDKANEDYLRESLFNLGDFLDSINEEFEKEIIAAIIYCNEIWLDSYDGGGYPLPSTKEIISVLPYIRKALRDRTLRMPVREEQKLPYGTEDHSEVNNYGTEVTVIDSHENGWIHRQNLWDLPVFRPMEPVNEEEIEQYARNFEAYTNGNYPELTLWFHDETGLDSVFKLLPWDVCSDEKEIEIDQEKQAKLDSFVCDLVEHLLDSVNGLEREVYTTILYMTGIELDYQYGWKFKLPAMEAIIDMLPVVQQKMRNGDSLTLEIREFYYVLHTPETEKKLESETVSPETGVTVTDEYCYFPVGTPRYRRTAVWKYDI